MYKAIIGKTTHTGVSWPMVYGLIKSEFKTKKQKKRFNAMKPLSNITRQDVDNGMVWQPLGNIYISSANVHVPEDESQYGRNE